MSEFEPPAEEMPPNSPPSPTAAPVGRILFPKRLPGWLPPLFYLLLGAVFLWRSLFTGDVFLPASLLGHIDPWRSSSLFSQLPSWNPLRWDGIGQFYPWRKFAAETLRSGSLPLWNPYQFCGTPFAANSQSAVFYPGNLLFLLIPDTARAFGWSVLLHLTLCGWFMYLLLRRLRCSEVAALAGGVVYAYSAWQVAWLQLPTFLCTSCWFPLLLRQVHIVWSGLQEIEEGRQGAKGKPFGATLADVGMLGVIIGMMLLAGHLQIALYGLLAGTLLAISLLLQSRARLRCLLAWSGGLALGLMLALPQLLPAIELSRISHRVGRPSAEGYRSYVEYGLPPSGAAALLLPDLFGGDVDPANPYWGFYAKHIPGGQAVAVYHNPAETAVYVGIIPLLLGLLACARGLRRDTFDRRTLFFALLAAAALLLALGTPLNALLYFGVPGFAQSGSPARCLVLWALAWSALAAFGLDALQEEFSTRREIISLYGAVLILLGLGLNLTARSLAAPPPGIRSLPVFQEVLARIGVDWIRLVLFAIAGLCILVWPMFQRSRRALSSTSGMSPIVPAILALIVLDLFWTGMGANPTARREQVYPETSGIAYLREHAGHERIFPVNLRWSLFAPASILLPAVLPPNAATVFSLRDVQGYDSLFSGRYKAYANKFARPNHVGDRDASPPEVGNIVFFQNANLPAVEETGAAFAVTAPYGSPGFAPNAVPQSMPIDTGDPGMTVYALPGKPARAQLSPAVPGSSLTWSEDTTTRVSLSVTAPSDTNLLLRDANMPGWRARIDTKLTPILSAQDNPVVRSAAVPAGQHTVSFGYEPASFRVGLYCSLLCLALLALITGARQMLRQ